jgi:Ig-like domain-containing protein
VDCWNVTRLLGGVAVPTPPRIVSWPMSQTAFTGENLSFTVKASGSKPLSYRWRLNGVALPGETNTLLQLGAVSTNQAGVYTVAITNGSGAVTSAPTVLTVLQTLDRAVALDAPGLDWTSGGDRIWYGQVTVNHDGTDAAQSAPIGNNQQVSLQTSVLGPGRVAFWWKVSSEDGFDFLDFLINDSTQASLTGEVDWVQRTFLVPAGPSTLTWIYSKDAATANGQDAAWVDQVSYVQAPVLASAKLVNGQLQLTMQAAPGQRIEVQTSTNLTNWAMIGALTNTSSAATFIDPAATNFNLRFYRTVTP